MIYLARKIKINYIISSKYKESEKGVINHLIAILNHLDASLAEIYSGLYVVLYKKYGDYFHKKREINIYLDNMLAERNNWKDERGLCFWLDEILTHELIHAYSNNKEEYKVVEANRLLWKELK